MLGGVGADGFCWALVSLRKKRTGYGMHIIALKGKLMVGGQWWWAVVVGSKGNGFTLHLTMGVSYFEMEGCSVFSSLIGGAKDPKFQPELSSTYQPVKCNIDCTCDNDGVQCVYERQYAEMSSSSGVLGEDIISFGNESALAPQRAVFGCENVETGDLYSQHADGIMGLGRGDLSVVDQLVDRGLISDSFSLCYGGMDVGGGAMVLGGISPPSDMAFTYSDPVRSPYYNIELKGINVAGKPLSVNPSVFDGKHGTILDSGTTYAYLPETAFLAFKDAITRELHLLKRIPGPDPNYNDICFSGAGSDVAQLSKIFPVVDMVFGNGEKLSLSPENYLFRHSKVHGAYCLGVFQNGKDPTTLLGGILVRNTLVAYDRENEKIGFWKTNCSELWERLNITGAPPPMPSASDRTNSTAEVSPTVAPTAPVQQMEIAYFGAGWKKHSCILIKHSCILNLFYPEKLDNLRLFYYKYTSPGVGLGSGIGRLGPWALGPGTSVLNVADLARVESAYLSRGELQDGLITFYMLLSVKYADLKPHITTLAHFIAHELDVNTSQVHLLNFTAKGNDSLIRWAILPARSAKYFSNATAVSIIAPLAEHRVRLPPNFGSYQLVEWNIEPPPKQTWWQQHYMVVAVSIIVTLVLGLSATGVWIVWRRRQQTLVSYQPVDAAIPEQELQPL
ncbi:hypothetical protein TEA_010016 [Camellia sinensis var. sinensis]|uniref:Peptidase A1 domain-containing protein n=1 Tax=Camellia sinensis var. sinensis TaxID=542762 RepID=A0A4S4EZ00_CAMSN|nr:hypothetical protein TEA_010016 [Camellia sinensis var. sinensis]